ncbi:hypothetical protein OMR07_06260 [Methylobacterium organophilum]|nr:hypothetical protein [Methylobacterium organophilum]
MRVSARSAVNRPTLDGVAQFGPSARAVVVVDRAGVVHVHFPRSGYRIEAR